MPQNHVKELASANATASGTLVSSGCRVHGIYWRGGATAGTVTFKDGGSGGTTKLIINTPGITTSGPTPCAFMPIPGDGLWFVTDCYVALSVADAVTILYSPEKVS